MADTWLGSLGKAIEDNAPLLLTIYGAISVPLTGILSGIAVVKAEQRLDKMRKDEKDADEEKAKQIRFDAYKDVGLIFLPTILVAGTGTAAIIGAYKKGEERNLALVAAAGVGAKSIKDNKQKVVNLVDKKIDTKEAFDKAQYVKRSGVIDGDWILDQLTGRKFKGTTAEIESILKEMQIIYDDRMYLSTFYELLDIDGAEIGVFMYWDKRQTDEIGIYLETGTCTNEYGHEVPCWKICYRDFCFEEGMLI